jgi:hypothetical protein
MNEYQTYHTAFAVLVLAMVSFYFGTLAKKKTPDKYLTEDAISSIRFIALPLILVSTMALVFMLNVSRTGFDKREALLEKVSSEIIQFDRLLLFYGPTANPVREEYRNYIRYVVDHRDEVFFGALDRKEVEPFASMVQQLPVPKGDTAKQATKDYLLDRLGELSATRFELSTYASKQIYTPTIILVTSWLCLIFFVAGGISPIGNPFVVAFGLFSAFSVSSVMFLILEYQQPLAGFIQLNTRPLELVAKTLQL